MSSYNPITDALNYDSVEAKRERARLYRRMVELIADNDDDGGSDRLKMSSMIGMVSVCICAWTFEKTNEQVARSVIRARKVRDKELETEVCK